MRSDGWRRLGAIGVAGLLLAAPDRARAAAAAWQSPAARPLVRLDAERCAGADHAAIERLLHVELRADLVPADVPGRSVTVIAISCHGDEFDLVVRDPLTAKTAQRTIDLAGKAANARARFVALAASELVISSWVELEVNPRPEVTAVGPAPRPEDQASARGVVLLRLDERSPTRTRASALVVRRFFPARGEALWGAGVQIAQDRPRRLAWSLDAVAEMGRQAFGLGEISTQSVAIGAAALLHTGPGALVGRGGLGIRAGLTTITGHPREPDLVVGESFLAPWGGPFVTGGASFGAGRRLVVDLVAEAGYGLVAASGVVDGGGAAGPAGVWLALEVALGWRS